jgi:nitrate/nitrite-specific signal transduction histidine kinase
MTSRLRWLTVVLPVVAIVALEIAADNFLDQLLPSPFDALVVPTGVLVVAVIVARFAFGRIDRLSQAVARRNRELERRNASLEALRQVGVAMTALSRVEDVLQAIVDNARRLLAADHSVITVTGPDGSPRVMAASGSEGAVEARLAVPLLRGDATIGSLVVSGRRGDHDYGPEDAEILLSLAGQAAIAMENDRLQRDLRELAVRGERERIAREMHDGLAQVLGYVNTKAQAVEELLAIGEVDRARQQLAELSTAARSVYVDVREAILGLTIPILSERGLVSALEVLAARFAEASKLATEVRASASARALELPPDVQANVFRIVQEALSNVRKHASAHRTEIDVDVADGQLRVSVADDGEGFDAAGARTGDWPHHGMQGIRERAASIHGEVGWSTRPGAGTMLVVTLPLRHAVEAR